MRGTARRVSPSGGLRVVCYCTDCQTYAHHLGCAEDVLDDHGGSDIFQTTPRNVTIDQGMENVRTLKQGPKGPLRWYADCCKTPIANVINDPRIPFAALVQPIMDLSEMDGGRDQVLGPVRSALVVDEAHGTPPHPNRKTWLYVRALWQMALGFLRGEQRPSPFFDDTGQPRVTPSVLSKEERRDLREKVRGGR